MSYEEAMELCHFGAKVIYPPTLILLREAGIPLVIRSTFDTHSKGTTISANPTPERACVACRPLTAWHL